MAAKAENVEYLVQRMLEAMERDSVYVAASAEDILSAALTLALRTIKATKQMGCDTQPLKEAVGMLFLECDEDAKTVQ